MPIPRPATTTADRRRVLEVQHAATESREPMARFQARRLALLRRHQGTWWLLEDGGRAVAALMCYPLAFRDRGADHEGYGIGAVATVHEARRRGFAARLCRAAIEAEEARGRGLGLLFSAVPPAMYERLGFRVAPGWDHVGPARELAASGPRSDLVPVDPRRDVGTWCDLYARGHPGLHLRRDEAAWLEALVRNPDDDLLALGEPARGYVRLDPEDAEAIDVVELMVPGDERAAALRAVAALAVEMGRAKVSGWFDPVPELAPHLEDRGRARTLPMVRGAADPSGARFWGSDYF
jgi:predicted N-acetyltransferase YhbS